MLCRLDLWLRNIAKLASGRANCGKVIRAIDENGADIFSGWLNTVLETGDILGLGFNG